MSITFRHFTMAAVLMAAIGISCGTARANWLETFDGNSFDLSTWQFGFRAILKGCFGQFSWMSASQEI